MNLWKLETQKISSRYHKKLARGREGLGKQLKTVTQAGRVFFKKAKTSGGYLRKGIR